MAHLPNRATHRWTRYDQAQQRAYYLTICTQDRLHLFGRIVDGVMHPSPIGELARRTADWDAIPEHIPHVDIGVFVVMPNQVHVIVVIRERLVNVRGRAMGCCPTARPHSPWACRRVATRLLGPGDP